MEAPSPSPLRSRRCGVLRAPTLPEFLAPRSLAAVRELAQLIACAEWAPDSYRDVERNYSVAKIELAIMQGAVVGLGPIASVQSIALIDGKPAIWGDGALAVVAHSGLLDDMAEEYFTDAEEGLTAISTLRRRDRPTPIVGRFSLAMAEEAQLTQREGPWRFYPRRMLMMRARSWALRDGFADVLRGLSIREEVEDYAGVQRSRSVADTGSGPENGWSQSWTPRPRFIAPRCAHRRAAADVFSGNIAAEEAGVGAVSAMVGPDAPEPIPAATRNASRSEPDIQDGAAPPVPSDAPITDSVATTEDSVYRLIDTEGVLIEVTGFTTLRRTFEGLFEGHLTPAQILGLWESNEGARAVIAEHGEEASLAALADRVAAARDVYDQRPRWRKLAARTSTRTNRNGHLGVRDLLSPDTLRLAIGPGWAEARVFRLYRRRLRDLQNGGAGTATAIATFREVNAPVEARLRTTLPELMGEIDAIYRWAATHAR